MGRRDGGKEGQNKKWQTETSQNRVTERMREIERRRRQRGREKNRLAQWRKREREREEDTWHATSPLILTINSRQSLGSCTPAADAVVPASWLTWGFNKSCTIQCNYTWKTEAIDKKCMKSWSLEVSDRKFANFKTSQFSHDQFAHSPRHPWRQWCYTKSTAQLLSKASGASSLSDTRARWEGAISMSTRKFFSLTLDGRGP